MNFAITYLPYSIIFTFKIKKHFSSIDYPNTNHYLRDFEFNMDEKALRVCLFGCEIRRIENFEDKMEKFFFLECVWLGGNEEK